MSVINLGNIRLQGYNGNFLQPNYEGVGGAGDFTPLMLPAGGFSQSPAAQVFELHLVAPGVVALWSALNQGMGGGYGYVFAASVYDGPSDPNLVCFYPQYIGPSNLETSSNTNFTISSVGPQQIALKSVGSGMYMSVSGNERGSGGSGDLNYHIIADGQSVGQAETFTLLSADGANPNLLIMRALDGLSGAHFQGADLRGLNLSGFDFSGADLSGADLTNADLSHTVYNDPTPANLSGVKFSTNNGTSNPTNLAGLNFLGCDLSGADLTGVRLNQTQLGAAAGSTPGPADLSGAIFNSENRTTEFLVGCDFRGVNLSGAKLAGCPFGETDLSGADLSGADLSNCFLGGVNLSGANLSGANLTQAQWGGGNISGADFGGAILNGVHLTGQTVFPPQTQPTFAGAPARLTQLHNATISATLLGTNWSALDLTGATVTDIPDDLAGLNAAHTIFPEQFDLSGAGRVLTQACFDDSSSTRLNFEQADLSGATFKNAQLYGVTMQGCNLSACDFDGAYLLPPNQSNYPYNADLRAAYLYNAKLTNATLDLADFSDAHFYGDDASVSGSTTMQDTGFERAVLSGLDFSQATLRGTKFNGAQLINCKFRGANVTEVQFESAYLQGADFSTATVTSANFTGAVFAIAPGQLTVVDGENKWTVVWDKTIPNADFFADNCTLPDGNPGPIRDNGQDIGQLVGTLQFQTPALQNELSQATFNPAPVSAALVSIFQQHNLTLSASSATLVRLSANNLWRIDNGDDDATATLKPAKLGATASGQTYTIIGQNNTFDVYLSVEQTPYPPEPPCVPESAGGDQAQGDHRCPPPPWPPF